MHNKVKSVVYLQGGLGNQLFQYALYLNLLSVNESTNLDVGRLLHDKLHNSVSVVDFLQLDRNRYLSSDNNLLPNLIKDSFSAKCIRFIMRTLNVRNFSSSHYDYDAMSSFSSLGYTKSTYVGYFQFVESALFVKSQFEFELLKLYKTQLKFHSCNYIGKVGLHIRRGDFVLSKNSRHNCVSLDYIRSAIGSSKSDIVVFSDDIVWCKENLSSYKSLVFHDGKSAFDDFLALSQCSSYILSGSTFSWWAAFLFSSPETEITFPHNHTAQFLSKASNETVGWRYNTV